MAKELISVKTRIRFREYFVRIPLGAIKDAFRAAGIPCSSEHRPQESGQRRSLVEQYYHSLDFSQWEDVKRALSVYEQVLEDLAAQAKGVSDEEARWAAREQPKLLQSLEQDGFRLKDGRFVADRDIVPVVDLQSAISTLDAPELTRQIARLRDSVNDDPGLAVGTAKEMLETICKTILEDSGVDVDPGWDVPALLKEARGILKLLPADIPSSAKGADIIKRLLSSLGQIGVGLSELRNLYGSGHGRSGKTKGLSPRHARLAVGAVSTLILFLFDTYQERKQSGPVSRVV
jgi:hypothetical protein